MTDVHLVSNGDTRSSPVEYRIARVLNKFEGHFFCAQEVKLQEAVLPQSAEMALSLYQYATLQYTRGLIDHGEDLCTSSLELCRQLHKKDSNSHVSQLYSPVLFSAIFSRQNLLVAMLPWKGITK